MQQTIKWQTHLSYFHLENLRVHNSFSENYKLKFKRKKSAHADALLGNRTSQLCPSVEFCGKVLDPMNATISRQKIDFVT